MSEKAIVDVGAAFSPGADYPEAPFDPPTRHPEFTGTPLIAGKLDERNQVYGMVREALFRRLGGFDARSNQVDLSALRRLGAIQRIVVKPNWVRQGEDRGRCVTTHGSVLRPIIDYLLLAFGSRCHIAVADVPLQSADLEKIWTETGIDRLRRHYEAGSQPVRFMDWRREKAIVGDSGFIVDRVSLPGDPSGYVEVNLGSRSFLEAVTTSRTVFSVNDYEPGADGCHHRTGEHGFLFPRSLLQADLLVNVPKLKTHCKAGMTACMKNLVGLNGDKGWIPHYRAGAPADGGDEYPDKGRRIMRLKSAFRAAAQGRHRWAFSLGQAVWTRYRRRYEMATGRQLLSGGAWPGNDTIWRSILDLVVAVTFADVNGALRTTPQRQHLCVVDAIVCGENEGPLNPDPRNVGAILCALDPVSADWAASQVAGLDWSRIPQLEQAGRLHSQSDAFPERFDALTVSGTAAGREMGSILDLPVVPLVPAPGWEEVSIAARSKSRGSRA